jgi:hypothetical protein
MMVESERVEHVNTSPINSVQRFLTRDVLNWVVDSDLPDRAPRTI